MATNRHRTSALPKDSQSDAKLMQGKEKVNYEKERERSNLLAMQ